jgi:N utilization substance protein A
VVSDPERQVITAVVDEDQLSLAIGRNGQNVRLASQLIGWQLDLYGSREWLERGADFPLFAGGEDQYETSDFSLEELGLPATTLAALNAAGYNTFLDIIDLEKIDFLKVEGLDEKEADRLLGIIDQLTVVEGEPPPETESGEDASASDVGSDDADGETGEPEDVTSENSDEPEEPED